MVIGYQSRGVSAIKSLYSIGPATIRSFSVIFRGKYARGFRRRAVLDELVNRMG